MNRISSILPRGRVASDLVCFIVRSISAPRMGGAGGKREERGEKRDRKENEENAGRRGGSGGGVIFYIPQSFGLSGFRNVDYKPFGVTATKVLTCRPILSRHYSSMMQDGLQIACPFDGGVAPDVPRENWQSCCLLSCSLALRSHV